MICSLFLILDKVLYYEFLPGYFQIKLNGVDKTPIVYMSDIFGPWYNNYNKGNLKISTNYEESNHDFTSPVTIQIKGGGCQDFTTLYDNKVINEGETLSIYFSTLLHKCPCEKMKEIVTLDENQCKSCSYSSDFGDGTMCDTCSGSKVADLLQEKCVSSCDTNQRIKTSKCVCIPGSHLNGNKCDLCEGATYSTGGDACEFCPSGTIPNVMKSECVSPDSCGENAINNGNGYCECVAGYELSKTDDICQKCEGATYSTGGSDTCHACSNANEIPNLLKTDCVSSSSCGSHTTSTNGYCECETGYSVSLNGECKLDCLPGSGMTSLGECVLETTILLVDQFHVRNTVVVKFQI